SVDQKFCSATPTTDLLQIALQLTFTNVSESKIILYRGSNVIVRTRVSRTLDDASIGKYELDSSTTVIQTEPDMKMIGAPKPGDAFAIIPPDGVLKTTASVSLEVSRSSKSPSFALSPGPHILQIVVSTWPRWFDSPDAVAARWRSSGSLWTNELVSQYATIYVDEHRSIETCAKYAKLFSRAKSDANAVDPSTGITALMAAIEIQDIDLFNDLLLRRADVNATAPGGMTALLVAAGTDGGFLR